MVIGAVAVDVAVIDDALLRLRRLWAVSKHRILDDGAAPVELSSLLVVEACVRCRNQGREANISDVARHANVAPSTASRLVDAAENAGLLHRQPSSASGRRTALVLTPVGEALRKRAVKARTAWLADQLSGWDSTDVHQFGELLQRFADEVGPQQTRPLTKTGDTPRPRNRRRSAEQESATTATGHGST